MYLYFCLRSIVRYFAQKMGSRLKFPEVEIYGGALFVARLSFCTKVEFSFSIHAADKRFAS